MENDFGYAVEREKSIIRQNKCQVDRVKTTLKQIMRDWSYLGKCERDAAYKPVIEEIERIFSDKDGKLANLKWCAPSRWSASLYRSMWNSDEMTIGKRHTTLFPDENIVLKYYL